ncbi:hypothetical protein INT43_003459, partial [Umbelopsis isabellina]
VLISLSTNRTNAIFGKATDTESLPFEQVYFYLTKTKLAEELSGSKTKVARPDIHYYSAEDKGGNKRYPVSFVSHNQFKDGASIQQYPTTIIGWTSTEGQLNPSTFAENVQFAELMHKVIAKNIDKIDDTALKGMAKWQQDGWLHVADERNPPPWGRIPLPEDIFGSVLLDKGVIQPNTYQRMPSHRFVTSDGLFKLSDPMQRVLVSTLLEEIQKSS